MNYLSRPDSGDTDTMNSCPQTLAVELRELLASSPYMDMPFFGRYLDFHEYFGNRLVIDIDPRQIAFQLMPTKTIDGQRITIADHFLGKGLWHSFYQPLGATTIYREVGDLIASGGRYRETPVYKELRHRLKRGKPSQRNLLPLDSTDKINRYLENVWSLIVSIRDEGYQRRPRYAGASGGEDAARQTSSLRPLLVELTESEIGAAVGPNGMIHRIGPGNHRMAIAQHLGLARVPVELRLFHVKWLRPLVASASDPLQALADGVQSLSATDIDQDTKET